MIEHKQGGYQAWKDEYATRKPSWKPIIFGFIFILLICSGVGVVVGMKIYADSIVYNYDSYERLEADHSLETPGIRLWSDMTLTAEADGIEATEETTPEVTPEVTAEIETTEELTIPTALVNGFPEDEPNPLVISTQAGIPAPLPTYTHYPTYTPQRPVVIREQQPPRVITSPPIVITSPPIVITSPPIVITVTGVIGVPVVATIELTATTEPEITDEPQQDTATATATPTSTLTATATLTSTLTNTATATATPTSTLTLEATQEITP